MIALKNRPWKELKSKITISNALVRITLKKCDFIPNC